MSDWSKKKTKQLLSDLFDHGHVNSIFYDLKWEIYGEIISDLEKLTQYKERKNGQPVEWTKYQMVSYVMDLIEKYEKKQRS